MKKYWGLFHIRLRASAQYRVSFITGILSALLQIAIQYAIWTQVFNSRITINGFARADMLTYLFVSQGLLMVFSFRNAPERMISQKIREGDIALELVHPVHFTIARFFENLGDSVVHMILAFLLILTCAFCFPEFVSPNRVGTIFLFLISSCLSYLIMFFISVVTGYLTFFTMNFWGIYNAKKAVIDLLSGALIPIALFPDSIQKVFSFLPFEKIVYTPVMIFLDKYSMQECTFQLGIQLLWVAILLCVNEWIYNAAVRRVSVNGG